MWDDVQTTPMAAAQPAGRGLGMMVPNAAGVRAASIPPAETLESRILGVDGNAYEGDLRATGRSRHFLRDRAIYTEGDDADCVFKVELGVVRTYKFLRDGRRQIYAFHGPGSLFGLEMGKAYGLSAAAASDCEVISYGRRNLERLAARNERLSLTLYSTVLGSLARAQQHTLSLGRRSAIEKLAIFLMSCSELPMVGADILLAMSRNDIADHLGLTIETVSRTFSDLVDRDFIELKGARHVCLLDIEGLRELCA
jgi:CRP/FNR family nitrogen fixation transcriptional regulator